MGINDLAGDIARALAFLSRVPVPPSAFEGDDGNLGRLSRAFPAAGLLIALPPAAVLAVLLAWHADPLMSAFIALGVQTLITGALHEDGLSDTADGLGGGKDREHALAIMKDSRIGTYGAIALVLSFGIRAAALAEVARELAPISAATTLLAVAAVSRAAMVWHWSILAAAKPDGVAASAGRPSPKDRQKASIAAVALAAVLLLPTTGPKALLGCLLVASLCALSFTAHVRRRISGHTGDTIGATQQICEIASFCTLALLA
jgi:adenosylcobinamide-GDP ribazoletransferase